jgi:CHASE3 domain sensor protein
MPHTVSSAGLSEQQCETEQGWRERANEQRTILTNNEQILQNLEQKAERIIKRINNTRLLTEEYEKNIHHWYSTTEKECFTKTNEPLDLKIAKATSIIPLALVTGYNNEATQMQDILNNLNDINNIPEEFNALYDQL